MKAPILLALAALSTAQAAEPTRRLMLACQGTVTIIEENRDGKPELNSMGIIINFKTRTVQGFDNPALPTNHPVKITGMNEAIIAFDGSGDSYSIRGAIDRVTGDLAASFTLRGTSSRSTNNYSLKCKPAQRMF